MSPNTSPGADDDRKVCASGEGWEDDRENRNRDSFVWNAEPDHSEGAAPEQADDDGGSTEIGADDGRGNDGDDHNSGDNDDHNYSNRPVAESSGAVTLDPERYLLAGETLVEHIEIDCGWVVVTTHRLLVYDPTADGKRFESVDRPNVLGVDATGGGNPKLLSYIARAAMYAVVLLGGGLVGRSLGLRGLFSTTVGSESTPAVDGLVSMLSLVGTLVGLIVDAFVWGGVVLGVAALGLSVWYLRSRYPTLVLERAGADDITVRLPSTGDRDRVVDALERALADELALTSS